MAVVRCPLSVVSEQPTVNSQQPTVNSQQSTVNSQQMLQIVAKIQENRI
ncbi:hypothetical protein IQ270_06545 [Microcoleus sp. LEGE 07076]|nr:hypothetical protein [Microcoleus sp. LEGE 07076]MBE9184386.1 hypothetical protein [Microcoleus sp. LEGE 07076]